MSNSVVVQVSHPLQSPHDGTTFNLALRACPPPLGCSPLNAQKTARKWRNSSNHSVSCSLLRIHLHKGSIQFDTVCVSGHTKDHRAALQSPHHAIHIYEPPWWRDATSYRNLRHESWSRDLSLIIIKRQNFTVFSWSNPFSFDLTVPSHFPFYSPSKHAALPPRQSTQIYRDILLYYDDFTKGKEV